jgi:hypothetical protein
MDARLFIVAIGIACIFSALVGLRRKSVYARRRERWRRGLETAWPYLVAASAAFAAAMVSLVLLLSSKLVFGNGMPDSILFAFIAVAAASALVIWMVMRPVCARRLRGRFDVAWRALVGVPSPAAGKPKPVDPYHDLD